MNLKELRELIDLVSEKGFAEFEIERQGFRLRISRFKEPTTLVVQPTPAVLSAAVVPPSTTPGLPDAEPTEAGAITGAQRAGQDEPAGAASETELFIVKSPIVGTFYRASSPTSEPFVKIGDHVDSETVVCIIEAMKLMNEIQAEASGEVTKVFAENGQPVEYGQPLFGIAR
jgi:acetyl-CoA carboxylase biotin carboxyl carrier protein